MRTTGLALRFVRSTRAVAAIEFAIFGSMIPILLMLGIQVVTYVNAVRKVELLASSISEMISQATPPSGSTTASVNYHDLHFSYDSGLVIFPYLMSDASRQNIAWWQDIWIDYASVQFVNIPGTSCAAGADQTPCYIANVVWTSTGTTGGNYRSCAIPQLPMNNTSAPNKLYIPRSIFGPGSVIVVDIVFTFHPTFAQNLLPNVRIARSIYVQPRYASLINYNTTNSDGIAIQCPTS